MMDSHLSKQDANVWTAQGSLINSPRTRCSSWKHSLKLRLPSDWKQVRDYLLMAKEGTDIHTHDHNGQSVIDFMQCKLLMWTVWIENFVTKKCDCFENQSIMYSIRNGNSLCWKCIVIIVVEYKWAQKSIALEGKMLAQVNELMEIQFVLSGWVFFLTKFGLDPPSFTWLHGWMEIKVKGKIW